MLAAAYVGFLTNKKDWCSRLERRNIIASPTAALRQASVAESPYMLPPEKDGSVNMIKHLDGHAHAFGPDEIRMLSDALDKAWQSVQGSGAIFDTDAHAESARTILANHIIEVAKQGERDQRQLCDGALAHFAKSNLRAASRRAS